MWAMDFQVDQTSDGRILNLLNVIDEYTRDCLATDVERSIDADGVVACLERIAAERGARPTCALTTGPSSSPTRWPTGVASPAPRPSSSTPAHRGRTPGSIRSTAVYATSTSTASASKPCSRPRSSRRAAGSTTRSTGLTAHMADSPGRVRQSLAHPTTAHTHIGSGSTKG